MPADLSTHYMMEAAEHAADRSSVLSNHPHEEESYRLESFYQQALIATCAVKWMKAAHIQHLDLSEHYSADAEEHAADRSSVLSNHPHEEESQLLESFYLQALVATCAVKWMKAAHIQHLDEHYSVEAEEHAADRSSAIANDELEEESTRLEDLYLEAAAPSSEEPWGKKQKLEPETPTSVLEAARIPEAYPVGLA
eukprot:5528861-Prymnesium_polylepis.2